MRNRPAVAGRRAAMKNKIKLSQLAAGDGSRPRLRVELPVGRRAALRAAGSGPLASQTTTNERTDQLTGRLIDNRPNEPLGRPLINHFARPSSATSGGATQTISALAERPINRWRGAGAATRPADLLLLFAPLGPNEPNPTVGQADELERPVSAGHLLPVCLLARLPLPLCLSASLPLCLSAPLDRCDCPQFESQFESIRVASGRHKQAPVCRLTTGRATFASASIRRRLGEFC